MEALLEQANALVAAHVVNGEPPRPDFTIPEEFQSTDPRIMMERKEGIKGRGWFAQQFIPAGTVLMVDKPLAMVMDWQDATGEDDDFDETAIEQDDDDDQVIGGSIMNDLLLLELLNGIQADSSLWTTKLSNLYPRDNETAATLPAWVCRDDALFVAIESAIQELERMFSDSDAKDIAKRLPLVVRYNVLSVETCPELLVYPGPNGHSVLSGSGIYYLPSFFNHDCKPNASRWAVGDVMWFVANQDIPQGDEICISYLEHDVLCETAARRTAMLDMDFSEEVDVGSTNNFDDDDDDGPLFPVVDAQVQNELMTMNVMERLDAIQELMSQATGESLPEDEIAAIGEDAMQVGQPGWFQCDVQNLRIIKAITLEGMAQSKEALAIWQECVAFAEEKLPPNDECSVVMHVQAALCAHHSGNAQAAKAHAIAAIERHNVVFGGGISRFRRRYERELKMAIRPKADVAADADALWPITS